MSDCSELDRCFELAVEIAKNAGEMIRAVWYEEKHVSSKSSAVDLVTETDQAVEKMIYDTIREAFPDHCFIGEESVAAGMKCKFTDAPTWLIDPIDGTTNFVHTFPYSCVSIALAVNRQVHLAVIYNPIMGNLYTARLGQGAFCNGKQLHVSNKTELSQSLVMTEYGSDANLDNMEMKLSNVRKILRKAHGIRSPGAAVPCLCYVAQGSADAHYEFGLHCWDMAAAQLLITEAGGVVMDTEGSHPIDTIEIRSLGSAALNTCFIASGTAEAYYEYGIHSWDYAAGALVVTEAGGVVMDTEGGELNLMARRIVAASHPNIAREICQTIQAVPYTHDCQ